MTGRTREILLALLVACAATTQALASVTASLDTSQIAAGDTVQLTLEHDGGTSGQPDLSPLQQDFDILGTSSSTTVQILNFHAAEKTEVVLTLAPKVTGHLTIPALSWDGERSQPISLDVSGPGDTGQPGAAGAPPAPRVFIETGASPETPYVEAAVHLTVRLFTSETLYHADLELPDSSDFVVKQVGSDENSNAERNGQSYQVVTRQYLLFPLHSGKLTLQGPELDAEVAVRQPATSDSDPFGGFFAGGFLRTVRPVRLRGDPIVLSVRPRPAGAVGGYWLPAREVALSAAWNPTKLSAQAGDPMTLDLDLQATGLTAAQLPDVASLLNFPPGLKAYPDQPKLSDSSQDGNLVGSRDQTIALMADSPGQYTIPALTVTWWDTQANQPRVATLPARTLTILPAAGSASPAPVTPPPVPAARSAPPPVAPQHTPLSAAAPKPTSIHSSSEWEWISIGLAAVWLATLGAWFWSRRPRTATRPSRGPSLPGPQGQPAPRRLPQDPARERAAFRAACDANDPHAARAHLLAWSAALWGATPAGVNTVAARIGDPTVADLLRDLDRACYAGGEWQGGPLAAALTELPAAPGKGQRQRDGLAPLYP